MATIPGSYRKTILNIEVGEAHKASDRFMQANFAHGFRGEWEISRRKDSPSGSRVNLFVYCRKA